MAQIAILQRKCTGCGLCQSNCPFGAIDMTEQGPELNAACKVCGICVKSCPVGIIDPADPSHITDVSKCQRCFSCVKKCPKQAKYFDAEGILKGMAMLKANCAARREPEFFL